MATTRRADRSDIPRLIDITVSMHDAINGPHPHGPWIQACAEEFEERFANDPTFAAFVTETDDAGVVAFASGEIRRRFPGPTALRPVFGYALIGGTDPRHRRQGHMTASWRALLDYFVEHGCERVSIFSSQQAESMHRALGFERHEGWPVPMNWYADT